MFWWKTCEHRWLEIGRARIPGSGATEITGAGRMVLEALEAMHEHTSILLKCSNCGDVKDTIVRGWFPAAVEKSQPDGARKPTEAKP
jgi:hypothetical protein